MGLKGGKQERSRRPTGQTGSKKRSTNWEHAAIRGAMGTVVETNPRQENSLGTRKRPERTELRGPSDRGKGRKHLGPLIEGIISAAPYPQQEGGKGRAFGGPTNKHDKSTTAPL